MRVTLSSRADSHGIAHSLAVANSSLEILKITLTSQAPNFTELNLTNTPETIVYVAGLLHDICDHKYADNDPTALQIFIKELLGVNDAEVVKRIIDYGSYSKQKKGVVRLADLEPPMRFLRDVVSDADKIEAIGGVGVDRCIAYQRENANGDVSEAMIMADVRQHCDDKLLRLYGEFIYTAGGRAIAKPAHEEIVKWCEEYDEGKRKEDVNKETES